MINKLNLDHILFLDIETVPQAAQFDELDEDMKHLFAAKTEYLRKGEISPSEYYHRAGIWAEFGKIVCISIGYFASSEKNNSRFIVRSFYGDEERLLKEFKSYLIQNFSKRQHLLCAHNGKEFDFPFIARRMLIHGMELPYKLDLYGKKPWEVPHIDTLELWKFGDYKHFTSLKLLTKILKIPSPKDDIDGSQVRDVYYKENDLKRIVTYCEKDVIAVAQIILKLRQENLISEEHILYK